MWFSPLAISTIIVPSGNVTSTGSSLLVVPFPNCPYVLSPHVNTFPSTLKLIVWLPFVITFGDIVIPKSLAVCVSGTTSTWITPMFPECSWFAVTIVVPVFLPVNFIPIFPDVTSPSCGWVNSTTEESLEV